MIVDILFWTWSVILLFSGIKVISSKNPILSVFWLVICFIMGSLLLLLLGIEFLPILLMIVYVGAIAILFLFVVMLLNIKRIEITESTTRYVPVGFILGFIFFYELYYILRYELTVYNDPIESIQYSILNYTNIEKVGNVLYTEYWPYFIVSSLVLLVSMIGAIVLSLYHEKGVKRQDLFGQIATNYKDTVVKIK